MLTYVQLDFERYQGRADTAQKKTKRSERENVALAKHEVDLARAKEVSLVFVQRPLGWFLGGIRGGRERKRPF